MGFTGYKRSIVLAFNYDEVKQGVPQVKKQMALLNAEYKNTQAEIKAAGTTMDASGAKLDYLKEKYKIQTQTVEQHKKKLQDLEAAEVKDQKAIANTTISLRNAEAQLKTTQNQIKDATTEVKNQQTALGAAATQWTDFKDKMSEAGADVDAVAGNMQKVGAVMVAVGVGSAKLYMDFDTAMTKARTIADESQLSYDQMKKGVMELSNTYGLASGDMANGLYQVLSSGVETKDALMVLNDASKLAVTGFTDTTTAVDILTSIMNGYGLTAGDASKQVDQLIMTQKLGKLTVGDFASSIGDVIGIAATAKVPIVELESGIAALTLSGLGADKAITGVKGILNAVISPTAEASAKAKELGIQFNSTALESKGFAKFMEDVQKKTKGNKEDMATLFGNVRALNAAFILSGTGAEDFSRILEEVSKSGGMADEALSTITETSGFKLTQALAELKNNATEAGAAFTPIINAVTNFLGLLAKLPSGVIVAVTAFGGLLLIVGSLIKTVGTVATTINSVKGVMDIFNSTTGNTTYMTFVKWAAVIIGVVVALAALIALWNIATNKGDQMNETISKMSGSMASAQDNVVNKTQAASKRAYAIGTQYHKGGTALVGEYGPEEVILPVGSRVKTAKETKDSQISADNSRLEGLLTAVLKEMSEIKAGIAEQPYKQQQLLRMG